MVLPCGILQITYARTIFRILISICRCSAVLALEEVSPRSVSNSWTTHPVLLSEMSRDPSVRRTSLPCSSLSVKHGACVKIPLSLLIFWHHDGSIALCTCPMSKHPSTTLALYNQARTPTLSASNYVKRSTFLFVIGPPAARPDSASSTLSNYHSVKKKLARRGVLLRREGQRAIPLIDISPISLIWMRFSSWPDIPTIDNIIWQNHFSTTWGVSTP